MEDYPNVALGDGIAKRGSGNPSTVEVVFPNTTRWTNAANFLNATKVDTRQTSRFSPPPRIPFQPITGKLYPASPVTFTPVGARHRVTYVPPPIPATLRPQHSDAHEEVVTYQYSGMVGISATATPPPTLPPLPTPDYSCSDDPHGNLANSDITCLELLSWVGNNCEASMSLLSEAAPLQALIKDSCPSTCRSCPPPTPRPTPQPTIVPTRQPTPQPTPAPQPVEYQMCTRLSTPCQDDTTMCSANVPGNKCLERRDGSYRCECNAPGWIGSTQKTPVTPPSLAPAEPSPLCQDDPDGLLKQVALTCAALLSILRQDCQANVNSVSKTIPSGVRVLHLCPQSCRSCDQMGALGSNSGGMGRSGDGFFAAAYSRRAFFSPSGVCQDDPNNALDELDLFCADLLKRLSDINRRTNRTIPKSRQQALGLFCDYYVVTAVPNFKDLSARIRDQCPLMCNSCNPHESLPFLQCIPPPPACTHDYCRGSSGNTCKDYGDETYACVCDADGWLDGPTLFSVDDSTQFLLDQFSDNALQRLTQRSDRDPSPLSCIFNRCHLLQTCNSDAPGNTCTQFLNGSHACACSAPGYALVNKRVQGPDGMPVDIQVRHAHNLHICFTL